MTSGQLQREQSVLRAVERRLTSTLSLRPFRIVQLCLAVLLLTAAGLKTHQVATEPVLGDGLLESRWFLIALVEFELFFAFWLLGSLLTVAAVPLHAPSIGALCLARVPRGLWQFGVLLVIAFFVGWAAPAHGDQKDSESILRDLRAIFESQENAILSAKIEYVLISRSVTDGSETTVSRLRELLDGRDFGATPQVALDLVEQLDSSLSGLSLDDVSCVLTYSGDGVREDRFNGGKLTSFVSTHDADFWVREEMEQTHIYDSLACPIQPTRPDQFRLVPGVLSLDGCSVAREVAGIVRLGKSADSGARLELTCSQHDGFVFERSAALASIEKLDFQFGPVEHPGGIVLPTCRITATFLNGDLKSFRIAFIKAASLNVELDPMAFVVEGKKATRVLDHRGRFREPKICTLGEDSPDILLAMARQNTREANSQSDTSSFEKRWLLIFALGILFAIGFFYLWYRQGMPGSKG